MTDTQTGAGRADRFPFHCASCGEALAPDSPLLRARVYACSMACAERLQAQREQTRAPAPGRAAQRRAELISFKLLSAAVFAIVAVVAYQDGEIPWMPAFIGYIAAWAASGAIGVLVGSVRRRDCVGRYAPAGVETV